MSAPVPYRSVQLPAPYPSARHVEGDAGTAATRDLGPAAPSAGPVYVNPVLDVDGVDHGDPFVLEFCGEYVLYHSGPDGVHAYRSRDLVVWEPVGLVLAPQGSAWAQVEFWAPEVVREGNEFVMYVAATVPGGTVWSSGRAAGADGGDDERRRQGVARSQSPTGPFVLDPEPLVADEWAIDAHPFTDDDGSRWLFYNVRTDATRYVDGTVGTGNVVRRLGPDGRLVGPAEPVCSPTERWEGDDAGGRYWAEGAVVLKRGGWYHQMYSGGFFGGPGYAVGVARAPVVRGPWRKDERNPVFVSGRRITGPGHHMVVVGPDGATPYAVYHGYDGDRYGRKVHLDRLRWAGDAPRMGDGATLPGRPGEGDLPVPAPAVVDPDVPHRFVRAWVEGGIARVCGIDVVLPVRPSLVTAATDGRTAVVRLDGVVVARVDVDGAAPVPGDPLAVRGGTVVHAVTTSRLDDEHHHVLEAGTSASWSWGGRRPVTAEVAVRGRATLRLGRVERFVDTVELNGGTGFAVVVLESPDGADRLTVTADADTQVADVVLASRPGAAPGIPAPRVSP